MSLPRTGIVGLEIFDVVLDDSTPIPSSRAIEAKLEDERTTTTTTLPLLRNSYFHKLLEERLEEFATTPKLQQPFVALQVLELWRIQSPGGRFLKYDSQRQVWKDVGDKKAREQIAKAFRHLLKQSNRRNCTSSSSTNEADNSRPQEESISSKTGSQRPLDVEVASISCSDSRSKTSNRELGLDDNGSVLRHPLLPPRSSLTQTKKTISSFIQQNMRTRRLYSRSSDHERLVQLYQESIFRPKDEHGTPTNTNQGKTNALIISGLPGVGKTSLAYSLESRVLSQNGLFIRTKLSRVRAQQEREEPLAPRKAILQDIIRTVMDQTIRNPALQQRLCQKIVKAAGEEMDLLCQVVTAMARLKLLYNSHVEVATATRKIHQPRSSWNPSEELSELTMSKERSQSLRRRSSTSDQFLHHEQVVKQPDKTKPSSPVVGTNTLSLRRFEYAFHKILKALASPDHPLVIVLDDYPISDLLAPNKNTINDHSIDLASSVRSTGGLFFIMTCRIDPEDPSESFETLERKSEHSLPYIQNHHLPLSGLPQEAIHELLVDALSLESSKLELLSQTVSDLTKGNVLFVLEILRAFQDDELLRFDEIRKQWVCDDHLIRQHSILQVQSLKDLYRNKLMEQTTESQEVLKICACLGLEFRYDVLRMVVTNRAQLDSTLSAAEKHGFLGQYKNSEGRKYYSFCHDLIYQAAYQLIPDAERESWHFQMGQKLWNKARDDDHDLDAFLFVILEQLFAGEKLIRDMDDRIQVASLCLHAGEAMVKTSVFELSTTYLLRGIGLLGPTKFRKHNTYDLCLALHNNAIDTCYATGQMDTTEELIQVVLDNARVFEDEIRARIMLIYTRGTRRELDSAIHLGVETLARLGEKLDSNPSKWNVLFALVKTRRLLRRHSNLFLENLPATTNERILSVQIVLNVMWLSAYYSNPLLAALIACRMVQLSVNHGVSNVSSVGFAMFATNILRGGTNLTEARRYSDLAFSLAKRFGGETWLSRITVASYGLVNTWLEPMSYCLERLKDSYQVALGSGDIEFAMVNASLYLWNNIDRLPIYELEAQARNLTERMKFLGQEKGAYLLRPVWQMALSFMGSDTEAATTATAKFDPTDLIGDVLKEADIARLYQEARQGKATSTNASYYTMILAYHFSKFDKAVSFRPIMHRMYTNLGTSAAALARFYESLALLETMKHGSMSFLERRRRMSLVQRHLKMFRYWAKHCPANIMGKLYLIQAELARLQGDALQAQSHYYCSIVHASVDGGILLEHALANERAGKFELELGNHNKATDYLTEALRLYNEWGGTAKVDHLVRQVGHLVDLQQQ